MARGVVSWIDVQTTTEWVRRRMMERSCSGRGIVVSGWEVGGFAGAVCHDFEEREVWKLLYGDALRAEHWRRGRGLA